MRLFRVLRQSVQHLNQRGYLFIWANALCVLLMLPVVTAPAAWAGLVHFTHLSLTQRQVGLEDFWRGFRQNLLRGIGVFALNVLIVSINGINLWAYADDPSLAASLLRPIWAGVLVVWAILQLYLWPILLHMERPSVLGGLRNAGVMLLLNPFFTLGVVAMLLVFWAFSTVLTAAWLLLTLSAMSIFLTLAVMDRLGVRGYSE